MIEKKITDAVLLAHLKNIQKDKMTIFTMANNTIRGALFNGTEFVNKIRVQHNLGILETYVLGQATLCGALLIPTMKGHDRNVFRYDAQGELGGFSVEVASEGWVRGYLFENPIPITQEMSSWDLSPFIGRGVVSMVRFPEGAKMPVTGTIPIMHKNIPLDLAEYFLKSEQTRTAFNTGLKFDKEGRLIGAGGMYLQAMPGADDDDLKMAEQAFSAAPSLGEWFAEDGNDENIIYGLFKEFNPDILLRRDISFSCPCSSEKFLNHLRTLPNDELQDMINSDKESFDVYCHNCSSVYTYSKDDLKQILADR